MSCLRPLRFTSLAVPLLLFLVLLGCAAPPPSGGQTATPAPGASVTDSATLVEALRAEGRDVELGEALAPSFFSVAGKIVKVDGSDLQVFEFPDAAAAGAMASTVNATGDQIGTSMVTWMAPPHIFHHERIIVIYLGTDPDLQTLLTRLLGPQIAGR